MNKSLKIEYIPIEDIKPYENNAKLHPQEQIQQIKNSILEFGFDDPIAIWKDNIIIEGHGRLIAAQELGYKEIPVIRLDDLTDEQRRAYTLVHNKLTMNSGFDIEMLNIELGGIDRIDMSDFGFEFEPSFGDSAPVETVEDDFEAELPEEPKSKLGDIYQLGRHRLMCGDSTDVNVIDRLMDGVKADMVFTDPPYNMSDNLSGFVSDEMKSRLDKIVDFDPNTIIDTLLTVDTKNYFIFTSKDLIPKYFEIFKGYGFNILVWCKDNPTPMTNNTFLPDVEYLLYFYKHGRVWNNGLDVSVYKKFYNSNKMEGRKEAGNVHPTIKPIKIIADKIQICSNKNGIVLDLFGGSGSTLIACEQLDRSCYMMELDPKYVSVILQRYINFKGSDEDVFLIKDGKKIPYTEIAGH